VASWKMKNIWTDNIQMDLEIYFEAVKWTELCGWLGSITLSMSMAHQWDDDWQWCTQTRTWPSDTFSTSNPKWVALGLNQAQEVRNPHINISAQLCLCTSSFALGKSKISHNPLPLWNRWLCEHSNYTGLQNFKEASVCLHRSWRQQLGRGVKTTHPLSLDLNLLKFFSTTLKSVRRTMSLNRWYSLITQQNHSFTSVFLLHVWSILCIFSEAPQVV
jgi:hypothetical protein